jgi:hypothetical protein
MESKKAIKTCCCNNNRQTDFRLPVESCEEERLHGNSRKSYSNEKSRYITSEAPFPVGKENGSETVGTWVMKLIST